MQYVRSTNVRAVEYNLAERTLLVEFHSGGLYAYFGVPYALYLELLAAQPHPWTRVGKRVMRHRYRCLRRAA